MVKNAIKCSYLVGLSAFSTAFGLHCGRCTGGYKWFAQEFLGSVCAFLNGAQDLWLFKSLHPQPKRIHHSQPLGPWNLLAFCSQGDLPDPFWNDKIGKTMTPNFLCPLFKARPKWLCNGRRMIPDNASTGQAGQEIPIPWESMGSEVVPNIQMRR